MKLFRFGPLAIFLLALACGLGCKRVTEISGSSNGPSGQAGPFDGAWSGVTSQGYSMNFHVEQGAVTNLSYGYDCGTVGSVPQFTSRSFFIPYEIVNSSFSVNNYLGLDFSGEFSNGFLAGGHIFERYTSCSAPLSLTWNATKS